MTSALDVELTAVMVTTVLTFVAGFLLALLVERKKRQDTLRNAANSIAAELEFTRSVLASHVRTPAQVAAMQAAFLTGHLNTEFVIFRTAAYESALASGVLREFDSETQQQISRVYNDTKLANELELRFVELTTIPVAVTTTFLQSLGSYLVTLNTIEQRLQTEVDEVIGLLRGRFHRHNK